MVITVSGWFGLVVTLLTLAAITGVVAAWFKANYAKTQIEYLQRNVDLRDDRIEILEKENNTMSQDIALEKQKVESLSRQVQYLEGIVTGKEQLDALQRSLDLYARQNQEDHKTLIRNQERILEMFKEGAA